MTVPLQSITTAELNYESLATMGVGVYAAVQERVGSLITMISDQRFIQSMMSNYGILQLFKASKPTVLTTDPELNPKDVTAGILDTLSWAHMVPATFHWEMVAPEQYPVFDGRTTTLASSDVSITTNLLTGDFGDRFPNRVSADFNNDGILDVAVATSTASGGSPKNLITLLFGKGDGTFVQGATVGYALEYSIYDPWNCLDPSFATGGTISSFASSVAAIDLDGRNGPDLVYNIYSDISSIDSSGLCTESALRIAYQLNQGDGTFEQAQLLSGDHIENWGQSYTPFESKIELLGTGTFSGNPGLVVLASGPYQSNTSKVPLAVLTWQDARFNASFTASDDLR